MKIIHLLPLRFAFLFSVFLVTFSTFSLAQTEIITVVRNATLPNDESDMVINLQLKDGVLDVVTEDPIPRDEDNLNYNAQGGVIIGNLEIGQRADFIILSRFVDVNEGLLDTKNYAQFITVRGDIIKNSLSTINTEAVAESKAKEQGWLAYTPPPRIRMTNEKNKNNWNRFNSKYSNGVFAAALVLDRQFWLSQDARSKAQVGNLDSYSGGEIRALRIGAVGTFNFAKPWVWTLSGATHAFDDGFDQTESDEFTLYDARLDIPVFKKVSFSIGKQKEPISMERIMAMTDFPMQERSSVSDALMPSRNVGIVMAGSGFNDRISFAGGVFNNFIDKNQPSSIDNNATQYVGRATGIAYKSEDESTLLHLGVGLRYSDFKEDGALRRKPEFYNSPDFLYTALEFKPDDNGSWQQYEASLRSGPFWLHSEYVRMDIDSPSQGNPTLDGYHVTLSWIATGEMRTYNKGNGTFSGIPVSRSVNQNGWGAFELSTRFSTLDLTDGSLNGGEMDIWSAGINWWLTPVFNLNMNYRFIIMDKNDELGQSQGINARVMVLLE